MEIYPSPLQPADKIIVLSLKTPTLATFILLVSDVCNMMWIAVYFSKLKLLNIYI